MLVSPLSKLNLEPAGRASKPMNVCVVSSEFLGPVKTGGLGTATSGLVKQLASDGNRVTLLYTMVVHGKPQSGDQPWTHWVESLRREGITLESISHTGDNGAWLEKSWQVKEFIRERDFDLVYFNEHHGSGYYSLVAKRAGLAPFANQLHCVITHGAMEWVAEIDDYYMGQPRDLRWMGLERRSVELADVVIGPSVYLLKQYEKYGWRLPRQTFQQPYPLFRNKSASNTTARLPVNELVFFGRLETRKGLWLFCEALDRIPRLLSDKTVTFLGRVGTPSGLSPGFQIVNRSAKWPCRVRLFATFDQAEAVSYLAGGARLAVMPSLADNSPCVVYECMESGIPFIATRGSGTEELIDPNCWEEVMVQPTAKKLAEKLAYVLENGASFGRPRFDPQANLTTWSAWHRYVAQHRVNLIERANEFSGNTSALAVETALAALIVIIDNGTCALGHLIDSISLHVRRFGSRAAYLVLSSRRGMITEILSDVLTDHVKTCSTSIVIVEPRSLDEAYRLILASSTVFFVDAGTEMLTPFFMFALNTLKGRQRAVVSCVTVVRRSGKSDPEIEELPTGDLPGLSGLGEPIGGAAWGMSAANLAEQVSSLVLYDKEMDEFTSAFILGQHLMHKCRLANVPIHVFPIVGAIERRENDAVKRSTTIKDARIFASAMGITPSVYVGGAAWIAIVTSAANAESAGQFPVECSSFLPPDHPLNWTRSDNDLAQLAAALERPELAVQLEASKGPSAGQLRHLAMVAKSSLRQRPSWNLAELMINGEVTEFGREDGIAESGRQGSSTNNPPSQQNGITAYFDCRRLQTRKNKVRAVTNLRRGGPGRVCFFDVPLCGSSQLAAKLRSMQSDSILLRIRALDQTLGAEIGVASVRLVQNETSELVLPLYEIYGRATILLEFSGCEKMEVVVESLEVC
jgi:glycosyltransferase involved in cell wall biosynthesis